MPYRFLGHAAVGGSLVIGDKVYEPGDMVPLSKESVLQHQAAGLSFEGVEADDTVPAIPPTAPDNRPRDERGAVVESKASRS